MRKPPTTGPTICVRFIPADWSEIAFISRGRSTISGTRACLEGRIRAMVIPWIREDTTRCQRLRRPVKSRTPTIAATTRPMA